jgi:ribosomal protein L14
LLPHIVIVLRRQVAGDGVEDQAQEAEQTEKFSMFPHGGIVTRQKTKISRPRGEPVAYPTNSLAIVLNGIDQTAMQLKATLQAQVAAMAAGNVNSSTILGIYVRLKRDDTALAAAAATPGIVDYARDQKNNQSLDVAAEFTAMRNALANAISWVDTNFPAAGGYIQSHQISGGTVTERAFTPAQTAGFRTVLNAVIATIG